MFLFQTQTLLMRFGVKAQAMFGLLFCLQEKRAKRVNAGFPQWMLDKFDEQAQLLASNGQTIIGPRLKEYLDRKRGRHAL